LLTSMRSIRTPKTRARFLEALETTCNVTKACRLARVGRRSIYEWRDDDPAFKADWEKSLDRASDLLEEEAVRRAQHGVKKPVFQGGKRVGYVQEYSDTLMIFLLKGAKPKKYGDRTTLAGDKENPLNLRHQVDGSELIERIMGITSKPTKP